jgi:hypothetical protein
MKKMKKLNQILTKYKLIIVISILFVLGAYHLLMCLVKENVFNLNEESIKTTKFILIRFYHISHNLLIGFGFAFSWSKIFRWIWLYIGFRLIYTISLTIPIVREALSKTLTDGLSFGILIIVIVLILRNEKDI